MAKKIRVMVPDLRVEGRKLQQPRQVLLVRGLRNAAEKPLLRKRRTWRKLWWRGCSTRRLWRRLWRRLRRPTCRTRTTDFRRWRLRQWWQAVKPWCDPRDQIRSQCWRCWRQGLGRTLHFLSLHPWWLRSTYFNKSLYKRLKILFEITYNLMINNNLALTCPDIIWYCNGVVPRYKVQSEFNCF